MVISFTKSIHHPRLALCCRAGYLVSITAPLSNIRIDQFINQCPCPLWRGGHYEDTPGSYLHRLRSARTAAPAVGGGEATARRTRPCPGPADPPSPRSAKPRASICPRSVPDHDYRSVISARQLGSRSANRALLIRSRLSIQMETSQEVPTDQKRAAHLLLLLYSSTPPSTHCSSSLFPLGSGVRRPPRYRSSKRRTGGDSRVGGSAGARTNTQSHAHKQGEPAVCVCPSGLSAPSAPDPPLFFSWTEEKS